jgi:hypothetical protein
MNNNNNIEFLRRQIHFLNVDYYGVLHFLSSSTNRLDGMLKSGLRRTVMRGTNASHGLGEQSGLPRPGRPDDKQRECVFCKRGLNMIIPLMI